MLVAGYLTLSSSHTTAFLRCLQHGCPPPDNGPPLDVPKSDPCWDLITQGWSWLVISHEVEAALPSLPAFLAMANNSTNSISAASNELECAMMLAHYHKCGIPMKDAIDRVKAGGIQKLLAPCGQLCPEVCWWLPFPIVGIPVHLWYLGYINTFLFIHSIVCSNHQNVSIKFLTQATMQPGRQFNASLMMGQDMMEQLAMMDFKHPTQVFPYVRCAIWATMLTSPKSQDGYAKILTKQDLDKLRGPAHQAKVLQAEDQLAKSWEVAMGHHVPQSTGVKAFGKMVLRQPSRECPGRPPLMKT